MLVSEMELKKLTLSSIRVPDLKLLCKESDLSTKGNGSELIKTLIALPQELINKFIKNRYQQEIEARQKMIADKELMLELEKVNSINWGAVQGQLDQKIQSEYVRKYFRYDDLIRNIKSNLYDSITGYVTASWYNHWSTVLIEDHISNHSRITPTLKNSFGVDIFFDNQPFDLKTTYLPKEYPIAEAIKNPKNLAIWMYENQGEQRFGDDNRLFVILVDEKNPELSWKLKRDFEYVFKSIDNFFNSEKVTKDDEVIFNFKNKSYTAVTKVLIVKK